MRRLLFMYLITSSLIVAHDDSFPENFSHSTSQKFFELCKKRLRPHLREFVDDFAEWPPEDKDTVIVFDWYIAIDGLSQEKREHYHDGLWQWMACDTGRSASKHRLGICLAYLKNQN